jgi:hypothetical protein
MLQRRVCRHGKARCAEATLAAIVGHKGIQHRAKIVALCQALNGHHRAPAYLHGKKMAGIHRLAIHEDRARSALAAVTGAFRPSQVEVVAQDFEQRGAMVKVKRMDLGIDF